jgi:hypothetical protein
MVVFVGVTACVPPVVASEYVELSALSLMTTLVAFVAVTARVLLPPLATVDGLAVMEIVGAGAAADAVPPPHPFAANNRNDTEITTAAAEQKGFIGTKSPTSLESEQLTIVAHLSTRSSSLFRNMG